MNPAHEPESAAAYPVKAPSAGDTLPPDIDETSEAVAASEQAHPDPITGEPGAHPVGVGVGAMSAGAAGAAIGALGGPIGMLIGAAIGAVAGGLAGHEVAATTSAPAARDGSAADPVEEEPARGPTLPPVIPAEPYGAPGGSALSPGAFAAFGSTPQDAGMLSTGTTELSPRPVQGTMGTTGATNEAGLTAAGTTGLSPEVAAEVEDDALPTPAHAAVSGVTTAAGFQAPMVAGESDLAVVGGEPVRLSAYYLYLDRTRSGHPGDALGDWLEAEKSLA